MSRRRLETPTEVELEILQILWDHQPMTVREIVDVLNEGRPRAYTSILSMLNIMFEKRMVTRTMQGRAHVYRAEMSKDQTLGGFVKDLLGRAFRGSTTTLISQVLEQSQPSVEELKLIRQAIQQWGNEEKSR